MVNSQEAQECVFSCSVSFVCGIFLYQQFFLIKTNQVVMEMINFIFILCGKQAEIHFHLMKNVLHIHSFIPFNQHHHL